MLLSNIRLKLFGIFLFLILLNFIWFIKYDGYQTKTAYHYRTKNLTQKRDWQDNMAIDVALTEKDTGEVSTAVLFDEYKKALYEKYGYDAVLSDQISVNRSVPDTRPEECKNLKQLGQLPKAAVIITFFNDRLSVVVRTLHGIINRTPKEFLQEIILIDDGSTYEDLHGPLTDYLRFYLPTVRLIRLPERSGLMVARMTGARAASKESAVLIFMDAHIEVNNNWLTPLLEPIALNPKACTCSTIDEIAFTDFRYVIHEPFRGYFDWELNYKMYTVKEHEKMTQSKNFYEYVVMGSGVAIGAEFFWDLGGFDEGMLFWGGEQLELSFKVWMCGGEIIKVPCSRTAHLFRDPDTKRNANLYGNYSFENKNLRRLIDVWMDDEHRQYVFNRRPGVKDTDPGDLTDRFSIRDRLKCKSFSWMMANVMPDLKDIYPPIEPNDLAAGLLRSIYDPKFCVALTDDKKIILKSCPTNNLSQGNMYWIYTWRGHFRTNGNTCLESDLLNRRVNSMKCHEVEGNQKWFFDRKKQWIVQVKSKMCMIAYVKDQLVKIDFCDANDLSKKWTISHMYQKEMDKWEHKLNWSSFSLSSLV